MSENTFLFYLIRDSHRLLFVHIPLSNTCSTAEFRLISCDRHLAHMFYTIPLFFVNVNDPIDILSYCKPIPAVLLRFDKQS